MQHNILWTGREYYSLENCLIKEGEAGADILSTIIGMYERTIYQVSYHIKTNKDWHTTSLAIHSRQGNHIDHHLLESNGAGSWKMDGKDAPQYQGCLDVDIPLTPFTNTLPIRRLNMAHGAVQEIKVIYADMLAREIKPVRQQYTRLSGKEYHYQNIPNDFEATIQVDAHGFVVDYPELFIRSAIVESSY